MPQTPKTITTNRNKKAPNHTFQTGRSLSIFSSPCDDGWALPKGTLAGCCPLVLFFFAVLFFCGCCHQRKKVREGKKKKSHTSLLLLLTLTDRTASSCSPRDTHFCRRNEFDFENEVLRCRYFNRSWRGQTGSISTHFSTPEIPTRCRF